METSNEYEALYLFIVSSRLLEERQNFRQHICYNVIEGANISKQFTTVEATPIFCLVLSAMSKHLNIKLQSKSKEYCSLIYQINFVAGEEAQDAKNIIFRAFAENERTSMLPVLR